ncbi:MAG: hypothetical protein MPJ50_17090 [Pirellulales bacterium]|nr:hypothetical protein [Pirellulales bacterium]
MDRSRLILISSVSAVVVGLGITGYFLFAGDDNPTWDSNRPKPKPLVPKTYTSSAEAAADSTTKQPAVDVAPSITTDKPEDQAWFVEADGEMNFRVNLPGMIESFTPGETIDESLPGYAVLHETFSKARGIRTSRSSVDYSVTSGTLTPSDEESQTRLASFADELPKMLPGFKIQSQRQILLDVHPGVELVLGNAERGKTRIQRVYVAGGRMFLQAVEGAEVDATDSFVDGFFQSLVIENPTDRQLSESTDSADLDWTEIGGSTIGFQVLFPSPDVERINVLETLQNALSRSMLSDKWQRQRAQHESMQLKSGSRVFSVTAFLDGNPTAAEFSRNNIQKARMDALVKFSYGSELVKRKLNMPPIAGAKCDDMIVTTDNGKAIIVRAVNAGSSSYLLRVEGPSTLEPSNEAVLKFLTSLKVAASVVSDPSLTSKYKRAIVKRHHPYSGLDVQLSDGRVLSVKPTSLTSLLDPRGKKYEVTDDLLAETVLKIGGKVNLVVGPAAQMNMQRYVLEIQVVDDSRSSL